jgi:hypothetical protein
MLTVEVFALSPGQIERNCVDCLQDVLSKLFPQISIAKEIQSSKLTDQRSLRAAIRLREENLSESLLKRRLLLHAWTK